MSEFRITREVFSPAFLPEPLKMDGISLQTVDAASATGTIYAIGAVDAADRFEAGSAFQARLLSVLDLLAVSTFVASSTYGGSLLVERTGGSYASFVWVRVSRPSVTIRPDAFEEDPNIDRLASAAAAARHYRESLLWPSKLVSALQVLRAAEALAGDAIVHTRCSNQSCGQDIKCSNCGTAAQYKTTDAARLRTIIGGEDAHRYWYKKPGMRHRLMHGGHVPNLEEMGAHIDQLKYHVRTSIHEAVGVTTTLLDDDETGLASPKRESMMLWSDTGFPSLKDLGEIAAKGGLTTDSSPRRLLGDAAARAHAEF